MSTDRNVCATLQRRLPLPVIHDQLDRVVFLVIHVDRSLAEAFGAEEIPYAVVVYDELIIGGRIDVEGPAHATAVGDDGRRAPVLAALGVRRLAVVGDVVVRGDWFELVLQNAAAEPPGVAGDVARAGEIDHLLQIRPGRISALAVDADSGDEIDL